METSLPNITLSVIGGLVLILLIAKLAARPKQCEVCGISTKDSYRDPAGRLVTLCRPHLVERWKTDVLSFEYEMVCIEPDLLHYPDAYLYATIPTLKEWQYPQEPRDAVTAILDTISGKKCRSCGAKAMVAYFAKEEYPVPFFERITASPTYLCQKCMVEKIAPILLNAPKSFIEGVFAPGKDRGVFHVQEF